MTIFIGNLPFAATEEDLRALFQDYGTVVSIAIPVNRENGRMRGFAFVALDSEQHEADAIRDLHGSSLMGRTLRVDHDDRSGNRPAPRPQLRDQPVLAREIEPNPVDQDLGDSINVPMEYRAQVKGRCQRQFVFKQPRGATEWLDSHAYVREWRTAALPQHSYNQKEWQQSIAPSSGAEPDAQRNRTYLRLDVSVDWRLISNSGIDEGFIRPVIGPGGWPMIPGSSIKGLFKRACATGEDRKRWCGGVLAEQKTQAGILRFHGAWPKDATWGKTMLDIAHPQSNWQVGFQSGNETHNAYAVISLFKPILSIGISSAIALEEVEWNCVRDTLAKALTMGLGGRTAAGYGRISVPNEVSSADLGGDCLLKCSLEGQGSPSKRLLGEDGLMGTDEIRPTMFRAAIRCMALRLFGGLTDEETALRTVGLLFGSIGLKEGQNLGLLTTAYTNAAETLGFFRCHGKQLPAFTTLGCLEWRMVPNHPTQVDLDLLQNLLAALHGITMALGGFGRGWRRPDHRIFCPSYYEQTYEGGRPVYKALIGCHWEWRNPGSLPDWATVKTDQDLARLIAKSRQYATQWLIHRGASVDRVAQWREVIHPERMVIWTRSAKTTNDAMALDWFHRPADGKPRLSPRDLRKSDIAGKMGQVGCIWNRLLPIEYDETTLVTAKIRQQVYPSPSANPTTRPAPALVRPGAATQRPRRAEAPHPPVPPSQASPVQDEVWMNHSPGPFLESLVLFPKACESASFVEAMRRDEVNGDGKGFKKLIWA